jgi:hypothetical protein
VAAQYFYFIALFPAPISPAITFLFRKYDALMTC